jgi:hypothetical protein
VQADPALAPAAFNTRDLREKLPVQDTSKPLLHPQLQFLLELARLVPSVELEMRTTSIPNKFNWLGLTEDSKAISGVRKVCALDPIP